MKNTIIKKNSYYDSVTLMSLSGKISGLEGVLEAVVSMATDMNKELIKNIGLSNEQSNLASSNDLLIGISAIDEESYHKALAVVEELLTVRNNNETTGKQAQPKNINQALKDTDANLAIISVPGIYAAREARIALENNLHVMIFSDNVSLEDERKLKELGREKGLLVMGPDCGTASINNVGLCFSNKVRKGNIGIIGASGTGLQEVMVQIHRLGGGISQAIGTGGRDLKEEIGGIMMIESLKALNEDQNTDLIVLVSKPPAKSVEMKILNEIKNIQKNVVVCFLDGTKEHEEIPNATFVYGLLDAAKVAVNNAGINKPVNTIQSTNCINIDDLKKSLNSQQKYFRGLYCGGTLCAEALSILRTDFINIKSNVSKVESEKLSNYDNYKGNVLLDLGEDEFTSGKPHPMIEPSLRLDRLISEANDPEVGVILLDFELGYGSHEDPVGVTLHAIRESNRIANANGRKLIFVAYICGTDFDKQNYETQRMMLENEGVIVVDSNTDAANLVIDLLSE